MLGPVLAGIQSTVHVCVELRWVRVIDCGGHFILMVGDVGVSGGWMGGERLGLADRCMMNGYETNDEWLSMQWTLVRKVIGAQ